MFRDERLQGTPEKSTKGRIVVQTRKGGEGLDNYISPDPNWQQQNCYRRIREQHGQNWLNRKPATGGYNCAGLVWASRRTCLTNPKQWRQILCDDGYRPTNESDLCPGDVAVYAKADEVGKVAEPEILHVSRVCHLHSHPVAGTIPWVISKWDGQYGEDIHAARDCGQLVGGEPYVLEFWTDRPKEQKSIILPEDFDA